MRNTFYCLLVIAFITGCKKNVRTTGDPTTGLTVTTDTTRVLTSVSATSGGTVSSNGNGNNVTERGLCYNTSSDPTIANSKVPSGSGLGNFICTLSALDANKTYYVRAYATNNMGTTYGNQIMITTPALMTDADGNIYHTIKIGPQVWMAGNMRTTKYRNGTPIPNVTDSLVWATLNTGAYCNYDNDPANVNTYGRLYNWYAATDANNIAPAGWHMPTYDEWQVLANYLGGTNEAGGHLKEAGFAHWTAPNTGADNSSGFTALPSGARYYLYPPLSSSGFLGMGTYSPWWTSTSVNSTDARFTEVDWQTTNMHRTVFFFGVGHYDKRSGYAIRLLKD